MVATWNATNFFVSQNSIILSKKIKTFCIDNFLYNQQDINIDFGV